MDDLGEKVDRFLQEKAEELWNKVKSLGDPPYGMVVRLASSLESRPQVETARVVIAELCNYYNVPVPLVLSYREAVDYVNQLGPRRQSVQKELTRMRDVKPGGAYGATLSSYGGKVRSPNMIILSDTLFTPPRDFTLNLTVFHEFFHWLSIQSMPPLEGPILTAFISFIREVEEDLTLQRAIHVLRKAGF